MEVSDEFRAWYTGLNTNERASVASCVGMLERFGPELGRPYVDTLKGSKFPNLKELRVQHQGRPYRVLFAFDPRRNAYLILGGDKTGEKIGTSTQFVALMQYTPNTSKRLESEIMAHKWRDIRGTFSPEVEAMIEQQVKDAAGVMTLYQLREARSLTQVNLAKVLEVNQGAVSRMEKRTDMYVSTLRSYIQAMGGQLQVKAIFPEGEVEIDQFGSMAEPPKEPRATTHA